MLIEKRGHVFKCACLFTVCNSVFIYVMCIGTHVNESDSVYSQTLSSSLKITDTTNTPVLL